MPTNSPPKLEGSSLAHCSLCGRTDAGGNSEYRSPDPVEVRKPFLQNRRYRGHHCDGIVFVCKRHKIAALLERSFRLAVATSPRSVPQISFYGVGQNSVSTVVVL